jgi:hypothetical protein
MSKVNEKTESDVISAPVSDSPSPVEGEVHDFDMQGEREVFKTGAGGVEFRTMSWKRTVVVFVKYTVATGILGIPTALNTLGAVGGAFNIIGWGAMNACMFVPFYNPAPPNEDTDTSVIAGRSRNKHPHCHTIVDLTRLFYGNIAAEVISVLFVLGYVLCVASAILSISVALNALSNHGACSAVFTLVGMVMTIMFASIRTWKSMTWPLAICFFCVMAAVLAVIIGAAQLSRPAAAPQEGPYDFGFVAVAYPNFAAGITAANAIFVSSTGCPGTIPIIAEMKRPQDFTKVTVYVACIVTVLYVTLSMTMCE